MNLITLHYTDPQDQHLPVNYRVYDISEGKTKNDYFLEMLAEVLEWGLKPAFVTADSWYSCVTNFLRFTAAQVKRAQNVFAPVGESLVYRFDIQ